jgi:hypothetical protein
MKRKAQFSFEFMTTYGWAILAILISIAALYYFGIFDLKSQIADQCFLGEDLRCDKYTMLQTNNEVKILAQGTTGKPIRIINFTCTYEDRNMFYNNSYSEATPLYIPHGAKEIIICKRSSTVYTDDEKHNVDLSVTYFVGVEGFPKTAQGYIVATYV